MTRSVTRCVMLFRTSRSQLLLTFASAVLVSACAVSGRGDGGSDDDDGGQEQNFTTVSSGTGSGGAGSGGASSSSTGDTTAPSSTGALAGSTSSTGTTSSTTTGGGSCPTSTLEFTDPVCGGCVATSCCSQLQTCDGSFDCLDFLACFQDCTDQTCADSCVEIYPFGADEYINLDDCLYNSCSFECGA